MATDLLEIPPIFDRRKAAAAPAVPTVVEPRQDVQHWAIRINSSYRQSVEAIIQTGKLLIEAKAAVDHGDWLPLVEQLDFSDKQAQRLMKIAHDPRIAKGTHGSLLPQSVRTLEEITRLDNILGLGHHHPDQERILGGRHLGADPAGLLAPSLPCALDLVELQGAVG